MMLGPLRTVEEEAGSLRLPPWRSHELWARDSLTVRCALGANPVCAQDVLRLLAQDVSAEVRSAVAENTCTPPVVLRRLVKDEAMVVRWALARNTACPAPLLRQLSGDFTLHVRHSVTRNPKSTATTLATLAGDFDTTVRTGAARNVHTPYATLAKLTADPAPWVRTAAQATMRLARPTSPTPRTAPSAPPGFRERREWVTFVVPYGRGVEEVTWSLVVGGFDGSLRSAVLASVGALA